MIKKRWLLLVFLSLFLTGCPYYTTLIKTVPSDPFNQVFESIYNIKVYDEKDQNISSGIALALTEELLLTLNHVVSIYFLQREYEGISIMIPLDISIQRVVLIQDDGEIKLDFILRDEDGDVALLKSPLPLKPLPYAWGDSRRIKTGDAVYLVGNAFSLGLNVRSGIVSAVAAPPIMTRFGISPERTFMIDTGVFRGDSAGPVFAFRNGQPEIIGLAQAMLSLAPNFGYALRSEFILEKIKEYYDPKKKIEIGIMN